MDGVEVSMNDQMHSMVDKYTFLDQMEPIEHISLTYLEGMRNIRSKVQRTVNEKTDSAVYSIKASIKFANSDIYMNDAFLSASTQSVVSFEGCSIRDIEATN